MSAPCHVCQTNAVDTCVRCERATCDEHFFDQEHFALCQVCERELNDLLASGEVLMSWPYPVRKQPRSPGDVGR